jgi:hypothetical protein
MPAQPHLLVGLRAVADTTRGRSISRNGNQMQRFEVVLDLSPTEYLSLNFGSAGSYQHTREKFPRNSEAAFLPPQRPPCHR